MYFIAGQGWLSPQLIKINYINDKYYIAYLIDYYGRIRDGWQHIVCHLQLLQTDCRMSPPTHCCRPHTSVQTQLWQWYLDSLYYEINENIDIHQADQLQLVATHKDNNMIGGFPCAIKTKLKRNWLIMMKSNNQPLCLNYQSIHRSKGFQPDWTII